MSRATNARRGSKTQPVPLPGGPGYRDRCLAACRYFILHELVLGQPGNNAGYMKDETKQSCVILTSLGASLEVRYGELLERGETSTCARADNGAARRARPL